ncbi:Tyrosinase ustQ [Colletotrichum fructicola]|uniref:Tyrosinase central domain containing protein n=1 Tax=Colletotrichum fructicola (strain Nara gc5) TaxID=1213859 RepID=L2FID8_COLFN|nr:Tyrosinase ustQ [Colletotrichum fructicola]KAF4941225.1 Tyrosinase ustQ [Colletotrichum fructicola]KAF5509215.1 Tyrosinase ustQ [Colletotrichum fructicola]
MNLIHVVRRNTRWSLRGTLLEKVYVKSLLTLIILSLFIALSCWMGFEFLGHSETRCLTPSVRREWRTLSAADKKSYILAVKCLMDLPSIFDSQTSHFDDFTYAHITAGGSSHYAAAFLPWHRMFVHTYEQTLRQKCQYGGAQPYWNWVLDSRDLSQSPVWDSELGFGLDGGSEGDHCVEKGPFAGRRYAWRHLPEKGIAEMEPHCLSRWFRDRHSLEDAEDEVLFLKIYDRISPEYVNETLNAADYSSFFKKFEAGAHNAIPMFIRGEWLNFTATNDPVFFLHHAQVDRLWWLWQDHDPKGRLKEYFGPSENFLGEHHQNMESHSKDVLPMGGLVSDGKVEDYLSTSGGHLCYTYD